MKSVKRLFPKSTTWMVVFLALAMMVQVLLLVGLGYLVYQQKQLPAETPTPTEVVVEVTPTISPFVSPLATPSPSPQFAAQTVTTPTDLQEDALVAPPPQLGIQQFSIAAALSLPPHPALFDSYAINIVRVSCDPNRGESCSESWLNARPLSVTATEAKIAEGANWWPEAISRNPLTKGTKPSFVVQKFTAQIAWEPIRHPYDFQFTWADEAITYVMNSQGIAIDPSWNLFDKTRRFNMEMAARTGKRQGYTVFLVDSLNDTDGCFAADSQGKVKCAYSYLADPSPSFGVLTYESGGYGPSQLNLVMAHESGHGLYGALDQYPPIPCDITAGYGKYGPWPQSTANKDSAAGSGCEVPPTPGIMAVSANSYSQYLVSTSTFAQIGLTDVGKLVNGQVVSGSDGYPDLVLPDIICNDTETQITCSVQAAPLPVSGTTQRPLPTVTLYFKTSAPATIFPAKLGQLDSQSGGVVILDFNGIHAGKEVKAVMACVKVSGMPDYCEFVRAYKSYLTIILK